ncbi:MAG: archaetidylserine decarboxylase [Pseudomonadota bacterium]
MKDRLFVLLQYPLPHHFLSRLVMLLTRVEIAPVKNWMISVFVRRYGIRLDELAEPSPAAYPSFNSFFTRALKPGARPVVAGEDEIACPVDGTVSQAGRIEHDRIFQAKGHAYTLEALLGGDVGLAAEFADGSFATIYLSPRDYHRVHMPEAGRLRRMLYVPGRLFSVNAAAVRRVPELFARNERMVCMFDTAHGPMAVILVGALFVGSMETVWGKPPAWINLHETNRPHRHAGVKYADYDEPASHVALARGEEMGRFNMGSTVIVLFAKNAMQLDAAVRSGQPVKMGQLLGRWLAPRAGGAE